MKRLSSWLAVWLCIGAFFVYACSSDNGGPPEPGEAGSAGDAGAISDAGRGGDPSGGTGNADKGGNSGTFPTSAGAGSIDESNAGSGYGGTAGASEEQGGSANTNVAGAAGNDAMGGGPGGFPTGEQAAEELGDLLSGERSEHLMSLGAALEAALPDWQLAYLDQIDWSKQTADTFLGDPVIMKALQVVLGAKSSGGKAQAAALRYEVGDGSILANETSSDTCSAAKASVANALLLVLAKFSLNPLAVAVCAAVPTLPNQLTIAACVAAVVFTVGVELGALFQIAIDAVLDKIFPCAFGGECLSDKAAAVQACKAKGLVFNGCSECNPPPPPTCDPATCSGCCGTDGVCKTFLQALAGKWRNCGTCDWSLSGSGAGSYECDNGEHGSISIAADGTANTQGVGPGGSGTASGSGTITGNVCGGSFSWTYEWQMPAFQGAKNPNQCTVVKVGN